MEEMQLEARLNYLQGVGLATIQIVQQLVRVIQEREVLPTAAIQDALSEVMANLKTDTPKSVSEMAIIEVAITTVERYFADG